jgi:anaphase-promoting complex subunit 8
LYDKLNEFNHAAAAFTEYVTENEPHADKSEVSQAYKYLANYYVKRNQVDEAYQYAQKCLEFEEVNMTAVRSLLEELRMLFSSYASIWLV